jgi:hypothetical protein
MTASTASLYRTILIADMVMLRLYPEIDWTGHLRRFLRDISSDLVRHAIETQFSSAFTAFQLARTPLAVAQTVEWAVDRLPQLGRATLHSLSSWERIVLAVLRLLRGSAAVAIVVAATLTFLPRQFVSRAGLGGFAQLVQDKTWPTLAVCVILLFTLGSLIRRAEST